MYSNDELNAEYKAYLKKDEIRAARRMAHFFALLNVLKQQAKTPEERAIAERALAQVQTVENSQANKVNAFELIFGMSLDCLAIKVGAEDQENYFTKLENELAAQSEFGTAVNPAYQYAKEIR